jgi:hypothetical protein
MTTLFDHIVNPPIVEVVRTDGEIDVRFVSDESAHIGHGMAYTKAEAATGTEDPSRFCDRTRHVGHNLKRVVGHGEVEASVSERQGCAIAQCVEDVGTGCTGVVQQREGRVDAHHSMATSGQIAGDSASPQPISMVRCPGGGRSWSKKTSR